MSRDEGFAIADVDTSLYGDTKVARLWRELGDQLLMGCAMSLLEATRLTSWREGERVKAEDAAPTWTPDIARLLAALVASGLLDRTHRIPKKSFETWFGAAKKRRDESRDRWREAKARARARSILNGDSDESPRGHHGESRVTVRPSVPTESKNGRDREGARGRRGASAPTRVGDVLAGELDPSIRAGLALLDREDER